MRSIKLLAALAVPAMFAACTNEELFKVDNTPQKMEEVVGTKLIGTDVSLDASMNDAETRVDFNTGAWHTDDVLGLAWLCTDDGPESDQLENGTFSRTGAHKLYANHMFSYDKEESAFTTKGNIYQGWYFAYYPWTYEPKVAQKVFKVNPAQGAAKEGQSVLSTRKGQNLFISNRQFLSADQVQDGEFTVPFQVQPVLSNIVVQTEPSATSSFATNEQMKNLPIKSITINVDRTGKKENAIFAEYLTLNAANIPAWVEKPTTGKDLDGTNKDNLLAQLYAETNPVLAVSNESGTAATRSESVTTSVVDAGFVAGTEGNQLITIVAPATANLDVDDVQIEIEAGMGKFVVKYVKDAAEGSDAATNNAAIEKLVERYKATYEDASGVKKVGSLTQPGKWVSFDITLYDDIFVTDFSNIACVKCWNDAINMVNILGRKAETFTITSKKACAHGGNGVIEFTDGITMPADENGIPTDCQITVKRNPNNVQGLADAYFMISGNLEEWPANLNTSSIKVVNNATINNAHTISAQLIENYGTLNVPTVTENGSYENTNELVTANSTAKAYYGVKNYGTINLAEWAKVSNVDNSGCVDEDGDVKEGRINVVYGSYVELTKDTEEGIIAHVVDAEDVKTPSRIAKLVTDWTMDYDGEQMKEYVGVNTLVLNESINLDLTWKDKDENINGDNDPYTPSEDGTITGETTNYGDLSKVNFEINGGSLKSSTTEKTVMNVTMNGGTIGESIKIAGRLTIVDGVNIVNATDIAGALNITDGSGTITSAASIASVNIEADNYTINAQTIEGDLTVIGETNNTVEVTGDIKGNVVAANASVTAANIDGTVEAKPATITANSISGNVTVSGESTINNANMAANLTVAEGAKVALNKVNVGGELVNNGTVTLTNETAANVETLTNNGQLTSNVDIDVTNVFLNPGSWTTLDSDTDAVGFDKVIWYTGKYFNEDMTLQGKVAQYAASLLADEITDAKAGATITLKGDVTLDEPLKITKEITLDLNGKTITAKGCNAINLAKDALLTIGGGDVKTDKNAICSLGGSVVINSGTYTTAGENMAAVYCEGLFDGTKHTDYAWNITINGGTFISEQQTAVVLYNNYYGLQTEGKAVLNGGTFNGKLYDLYVGYAKVTIEEECDFTHNVFYIEEGSIINDGAAYTENKKVESFDSL